MKSQHSGKMGPMQTVWWNAPDLMARCMNALLHMHVWHHDVLSCSMFVLYEYIANGNVPYGIKREKEKGNVSHKHMSPYCALWVYSIFVHYFLIHSWIWSTKIPKSNKQYANYISLYSIFRKEPKYAIGLYQWATNFEESGEKVKHKVYKESINLHSL